MIPYPVTVLQDYLRPLMPGVRFATKVPASPWTQLVQMMTAPAGSSEKPDHLSWRRIIFECRDKAGEVASYELCETTRKHVLESRFASIGIRWVDIIGEPANTYDPDDGSDICKMTVDVLMRANPR